MKNTSRTTTITDQTLKHNSKQDSSIDITDVSIISVGLTRYPHPHHRMLTDDEEEDIEVIHPLPNFHARLTSVAHSRTKQAMKKKMMMTMMIFHHHFYLVHIYYPIKIIMMI